MRRRNEQRQICRPAEFADAPNFDTLRKPPARLDSLHMLRDSDPFIYLFDELCAIQNFTYG